MHFAKQIKLPQLKASNYIKRSALPYLTLKIKKINVPFSAYLTIPMKVKKKRTACDNVPISIKEALWTQTTWPYPYQLEGYFYRTDLQLTFQ